MQNGKTTTSGLEKNPSSDGAVPKIDLSELSYGTKMLLDDMEHGMDRLHELLMANPIKANPDQTKEP